jgi:hypothetical protein
MTISWGPVTSDQLISTVEKLVITQLGDQLLGQSGAYEPI